jgi:cytochrome P450
MNIVVDVLSIHYDPVLWGPVDPEKFYPERFLTKRIQTAWLPFGKLYKFKLKLKIKFKSL